MGRGDVGWLDVDPEIAVQARAPGINLIFYYVGGNCYIGSDCERFPASRWNHCQPTSVKIIMAENPLRETVTAEGPSDLGDMFEAGNPLIESMASAADSLFRTTPMPVRLLEAFARGPNERTQMVAEGRAKRPRVAMRRIVAKTARHSKVTVKSNRNGNSIRA